MCHKFFYIVERPGNSSSLYILQCLIESGSFLFIQ